MKKTYTLAAFHLSLLSIAIGFSSCENKFKETAPVDVAVKLVNPDVSEHVTFTGGTMYLSAFGMTGDRKQGDDVTFMNDLSEGTSSDLAAGTINPALNYDLPQGTYTSLDMKLGVKPKQNIGAIELIGTYVQESSGEQETHRIIFRYEPATIYSMKMASSGEINVIADQSTKAIVELNAQYLFSGIPESMWSTSDHVEVDGLETILVNPTNNPTIYNILISRLNESFSAHIE
jgi:hypothetical protein